MEKEIIKGLLGHIVGYHPLLARVLGSVKAAIFVGQLLYWTGKEKNGDGWIYKTQEEMEEETALSRYEQEEARKKIKEIGVLLEKKQGIPARLYYKIDLDKLYELLCAYKDAENPQTRMGKTSKLYNVIHKNTIQKNTNYSDSHESGDELEIIPDEDITSTHTLRRKEIIQTKGYDPVQTNELLEWGIEQIGRRFPHPLKQKKAISAMLSAGYTPQEIKDKWMEMTEDQYWADKGIDFAVVANQIHKYKKTNKSLLWE